MDVAALARRVDALQPSLAKREFRAHEGKEGEASSASTISERAATHSTSSRCALPAAAVDRNELLFGDIMQQVEKLAKLLHRGRRRSWMSNLTTSAAKLVDRVRVLRAAVDNRVAGRLAVPPRSARPPKAGYGTGAIPVAGSDMATSFDGTRYARSRSIPRSRSTKPFILRGFCAARLAALEVAGASWRSGRYASSATRV